MNFGLAYQILSSFLWLAACLLAVFSWGSFGKNGAVHGLFLLMCLVLFGANFALTRLNPKKNWQRMILLLSKVMWTLLVLVILSGEYHRLFHEELPLFD